MVEYAEKPFDMIIIGGGMVGASLAALLPDDFRVLLLESFDLPQAGQALPQPSFDARSSALAHASMLILQQAGIWPAMVRARRSTRVRVGERTSAAGA